MGITWEEVEVAAQDRSEWRRSVAQCIHLECGLNQGQGHASDNELQIVHNAWLRYRLEYKVKFTLTVFNNLISFVLNSFIKHRLALAALLLQHFDAGGWTSVSGFCFVIRRPVLTFCFKRCSP